MSTPLPRTITLPNRATCRVIEAVANHLHLDRSAVLSRDKSKTSTLGRQIVAYVLRTFQHPTPSYPELGRELSLDHTTVMNAVKSVNRKAADDDYIRDAIEIGRLALLSLDPGHEVRRLSLLAMRDRHVRKATELNEELAQLRMAGGGE